jgi:hypothetical protein
MSRGRYRVVVIEARGELSVRDFDDRGKTLRLPLMSVAEASAAIRRTHA